LALPANATSNVVDVFTDGACEAANDPPYGILVAGLWSPSCTVKVRLADGTELQSTVSLETFGENYCRAAVTGATPLERVDAGVVD
jgi:hypothetical protein